MAGPATEVVVVAGGLVTAVGLNAAATCAAIRAGISGAEEAKLWDGENGEWLVAGKVNLPQWWDGCGKLVNLVGPAIRECFGAATMVSADDIPILLGVAELQRPHRTAGLDEALLDEIADALGVSKNPLSAIFPEGQVSGVLAVQQARRILASGRAAYCIVAGVDSFLSQAVVSAYMERRRILTSSNSNGFIPGEAGCAVLLCTSEQRQADGLLILGTGNAQEAATIESEEPLRADGLATAIRIALDASGLTILDTSYRLTDLNGEHYKFKESSFAVTRLEHERRAMTFDMWHPIEYVGEIGAAIVPCLLTIALYAHRKKYAPGPAVLIHVGSDSGERAALVAQYATQER